MHFYGNDKCVPIYFVWKDVVLIQIKWFTWAHSWIKYCRSGTSSTPLVPKGQGWAKLGAMISWHLLRNSRRPGTTDLKAAQEPLTRRLKDPYSSKWHANCPNLSDVQKALCADTWNVKKSTTVSAIQKTNHPVSRWHTGLGAVSPAHLYMHACRCVQTHKGWGDEVNSSFFLNLQKDLKEIFSI